MALFIYMECLTSQQEHIVYVLGEWIYKKIYKILQKKTTVWSGMAARPAAPAPWRLQGQPGLWGQTLSQAVKSTCCSFRASMSGSQHPHLST